MRFTTDFAAPPYTLPQAFDEATTCAIRVPAGGIVYQPLERHHYAHYTMTACAKVHGSSPCRVEVRDWADRLMDWIEFAPANRSCVETSFGARECLRWDNTITYNRVAIRYEGKTPTTIRVRTLQGFNDASSELSFDVEPGQEFNISATDFDATAVDAPLPDRLIMIAGSETTREYIDILTLSGPSTIAPGQYFGDESRYLMANAWSKDQYICPVSEGADLQTCACEEADVAQSCSVSQKGFVALPDQQYYIGLVSGECSCQFDSICLQQAGNEEGYFGLPWLETKFNSEL